MGPVSESAAAEPEGWALPHLDYPTFRITLLAKYMDRLTIRQLSQLSELSYAEWRVLSRLALMQHGGTVGKVAALAWVDRAEVSRAAASLEKRGMVKRRENPADRRTPILTLTDAGHAEQERIIAAREDYHRILTQDLSEAETRQLDELLQKVANRVLWMMGQPGEPGKD